MHASRSRPIAYIAALQFLPLVLFPWPLSAASFVFIAVLITLSAFLGWALIGRKAWGRVLTIFVQGFNIIVRIITLFANVYKPESGLNIPFLVTYVLSAILSAVILSYIDRPEIQLVFES